MPILSQRSYATPVTENDTVTFEFTGHVKLTVPSFVTQDWIDEFVKHDDFYIKAVESGVTVGSTNEVTSFSMPFPSKG